MDEVGLEPTNLSGRIYSPLSLPLDDSSLENSVAAVPTDDHAIGRGLELCS